MFVNEDDSLWAMGKGLSGPKDQGWLRELERPTDCRDFKKVFHGKQFRLVFTESGKLFVNGNKAAYDDILSIRDESKETMNSFQEVDIEKSFNGLDA